MLLTFCTLLFYLFLSSRRAADDIVASTGEPEEGAGLDIEDNDSVGSKNGVANGTANVSANTAAARKKPKRRRY